MRSACFRISLACCVACSAVVCFGESSEPREDRTSQASKARGWAPKPWAIGGGNAEDRGGANAAIQRDRPTPYKALSQTSPTPGPWGQRAFNFGGDGVNTALWLAASPQTNQKKSSIDGPP